MHFRSERLPAGGANQADEHALNDELVDCLQVGVGGVFGFEVGLAVFVDEAFEGGFAIDEGGDDIAVASLPFFKDRVITREDMGINHGIPADTEGKGGGAFRKAEQGGVNGELGVSRGIGRGGQSGGDGAIDGDAEARWATEVLGKNEGARLAGELFDGTFAFEGSQMTDCCCLAGKAKMLLNLARRGHDTRGAVEAANEVEQLLLAGGKHGNMKSVRWNRLAFLLMARNFPQKNCVFDLSGSLRCRLARWWKLVGWLVVAGCGWGWGGGHGWADEAPSGGGAKVVEIGAADGKEAGTLPRLTNELAQRAAAAVSKRDWKSARAAYQEMVDAEPENAPALANLGAVEYQLKEYEAAIGHLERALVARPGLTQTWLTLGMVHYDRDDPLRALSAISRAVADKPDDPRARNHLAVAAKALGWLGAAEIELQRALDLDPAYAEAHFNLALIYLERRPPALELARRHYLRAVELGIPRDGLVENQLNDPANEEINNSEPSSAEPATPSTPSPAAKPTVPKKSPAASNPKPQSRAGVPQRRSPTER